MRVLPYLLVLALAGCIVPNTSFAPEPAPGVTPSAAPEAAPSTPYAGQEQRDIKALSAEEIQGYRTGAGLGYAKPAELNSYPGPLHALDMAGRLGLTDEQTATLTALRQDMLAKAVPLGDRYLFVEGAIEQGFRDGTLDEASLAALLQESGDIVAKLRLAHLEAHLATKNVLTPHQVALYDEARGYGPADHSAHEHG